MAGGIGIQADYTGPALPRLARRSSGTDQVRRLLSLAVILDGGRLSNAARVGCVTLQIVRDWVLRFSAERPDGLIARKAPGKASILNDEQRRALIAIVKSGPTRASHGVVRWRLIDLARWVRDEFGLLINKQTL